MLLRLGPVKGLLRNKQEWNRGFIASVAAFAMGAYFFSKEHFYVV